MVNKRYKKFGIQIFLCWIIVSFFLLFGVSIKITPPDIFIGEKYSCSQPTIEECAKKETSPIAIQQIKNNFQKTLKNTEKINTVLKLPLKTLEFDIIIVERGSEFQIRISAPKSTTTLLTGLDLKCIFDEKEILIDAYKQSEVIKTIQLIDLENEESASSTAEKIMHNFKGCSWFPQKNIEIRANISKTAYPGAAIDVVTVLNPYIIFEPKLFGKAFVFIFIAWFAIIGVAFALLRQICQIIQKGINYFFDEEMYIIIAKTERELAEAGEIKKRVFQEEQGIAAELVFDGKDAEADHFIAYSENKPVGATRVRYIDDGTIAKIERMAVLKEFRGQSIGRKMIEYILIYLRKKSVKRAILNAQEYTIGFYEKLGFKQDGDVFKEAGIPHIKMQKVL